MVKHNRRSKLYMLLMVLVGLVAAIILCIQRYGVEEQSMTIEQAMDYDAVVVMAKNDGYDLDTALRKAKDAGITSFTIYDTTLNKLTQRGDMSLVTKLGLQLYYPQYNIQNPNFNYYLVGKPKNQQDPYFDEVVQDLALRLGKKNVAVIENPTYRIAGLNGIMPALGDVNLGILSADANIIAAHGFHVILRPTNYSDPRPDQVQAFFDRTDKIQNVSGVMFVGKEVMGYSPVNGERKSMLDFTASNMNKRHMPFYMIESVNQLQYNQQDGMYDLAGLTHYNTARVYAMAKEELDKITPEEAAMRYYISDLERNCRVNLFPLYKKPMHGMNLTETNFSYIKLVSDKLQDRGYTLGKATIMPSYYPNKVLFAIVAIAAVALGVFTLNLLWPLSDRVNYILLGVGTVFAIGGTIVAKGALFLQILAIGCAVAAPTAAVLLLLDYWKKRKITGQLGYHCVIRDGAIGLTCAVAIAMIGGLYIASLLGNIRFFMEFDFYRGVKLTFILPPLLVAIGYLRRFPLWGRTLATAADFKVFAKDFLNIPIKMGTLILLGFVAFAAMIFVGRSGHESGAPVPGFEVAMRRFLENAMYARPREKEFLIGHPAFFIMVAAVYRKWPQLIHFFAVIAMSIGVGSMVETFAHIRTPFVMSFVRGLDGWMAGLVIGCVLIVVIAFIEYITVWLNRKQVKARD